MPSILLAPRPLPLPPPPTSEGAPRVQGQGSPAKQVPDEPGHPRERWDAPQAPYTERKERGRWWAVAKARVLSSAQAPPHGLAPLPSPSRTPPILLSLALSSGAHPTGTPIIHRGPRATLESLRPMADTVPLPIPSLRSMMGLTEADAERSDGRLGSMPVKREIGWSGESPSRRRAQPRMIRLDPARCWVPYKRPERDRLHTPSLSASYRSILARARTALDAQGQQARAAGRVTTLDELSHDVDHPVVPPATVGFANHHEVYRALRGASDEQL